MSSGRPCIHGWGRGSGSGADISEGVFFTWGYLLGITIWGSQTYGLKKVGFGIKMFEERWLGKLGFKDINPLVKLIVVSLVVKGSLKISYFMLLKSELLLFLFSALRSVFCGGFGCHVWVYP